MRTPARCGTYSGYRSHLARGERSCEPCQIAAREYDRARRAKREKQLVDPTIARRKLRAWMGRGATLDTISAASGVPRATLDFVSSDRRRLITRWTHDRIMRSPEPDFGAYIPAEGTRRRIEALAAIGWSQHEVARRLGKSESWGERVKRSRRVHRSTAEAVRRIYDELSMTPGPSEWSRSWARAQGWIPPLGWDDDTIDDPGAWADLGAETDDFVDDAVVERLVLAFPCNVWRELNANREERIEAAKRLGADAVKVRSRLRAQGYGDQQIGVVSLSQIEDALGIKWHRDVAPLLEQEAS